MMKKLYIAGSCGNFATFIYESARQYIFSVIFIISGLKIIQCLVPHLYERLR